MKKLLLATATALALTSTAYAGDTATLKVVGKLAVGACTPDVNGGATVDYGTKYISNLSATSMNDLGVKNTNLTITCTSPTKVAWMAMDDRADSLETSIVLSGIPTTADSAFGAGKTAGGVNIGAYTVTVDTSAGVTIDGNAANVLVSDNDNASWSTTNNPVVRSNGTKIYSLAQTSTSAPDSFMTAVFPLKIELGVQSTNTLAITDDTNIDGQATITLKYL
ncbi:DUF1120 domain-containing protein [Salmonella enterica]|nr:DUF1120 domain-containing protein [Salmonella enterica]